MIVAALLVAACNGTEETEDLPGPDVTRPEPQGPVRELRLGLGVQPWEDTPSAHINTFATAAQQSALSIEVVLAGSPKRQSVKPIFAPTTSEFR